MHFDRRSLMAAALATAGTGRVAVAQADPSLRPLTSEPSRGLLFSRIIAAELKDDPAAAKDAAHYFSLYGPFRFPNDVVYDVAEQKARENSIFGVDISHYTSKDFPIEQLRQKQVQFLYMKASQGQCLYDPKFAKFYSRTKQLPAGSQVHPGAYHFLSSSDSGLEQARTFVKILKANGAVIGGKLRDTDMPPVLDLEWDVAVANGPDRWQAHKPADILREAKIFLEEVERETGRPPMLYTARAWWRERIGTEDMGALAAYPIWLADYSKTSRASEQPHGVGATPWTLWQFTESATLALGFHAGFDANIYKGTPEQFYASLGVKAFA